MPEVLGGGTPGLLAQLLGQVRQVAVSFIQLSPDTGKEQDAGGRVSKCLIEVKINSQKYIVDTKV
jgi:hypothetical protein